MNKFYISMLQVMATILCFLISSLSLSHAGVKLTVEDGSGYPGESGQVVVSLDNPNDKVKGVQVDVCDGDDYLTCTGCETSERAAGYGCSVNELDNGCCRVVVNPSGANLVDKGSGSIFTLSYDSVDDAPPEECRELNPEEIKVSDEAGDPFPSTDITSESGEFCFLKVAPITITPNPLWKSHWITLPYLLVIKGAKTHFQAFTTTLDFQPPQAVVPLGAIVWDQYYIWERVLVMPSWVAGEEDQTVIVTVTTKDETLQGSFEIELFPFLLDQKSIHQ